ncbi:MAG: tetratricopeptide repeat protein [Bryobacteraceae bacterium]|nr:tetratricopeptide repeat protein [Bryobacteraceae bacterium]
MTLIFLLALAMPPAAPPTTTDPLEAARDAQDRAQLERLVNQANAAANRQPNVATNQYRLALAQSYLAEVALELKDKPAARQAAESGIQAAQKTVALEAKSAQNHSLLGTLCAQVIPANVLAGLKYGRCALDEINKALEIDPKFADAWLRHGVGNYYLPAQFGGGTDLAIKDFEKAIQLNPKHSEAYLWMGVALRKVNRNGEARKAFAKAVELNPRRVWAKQQLEKTPAQ